MGTPVHSTVVIDGSNPAWTDRLLLGLKTSIANAAGSGAGASVTTAVSFTGGELPANYVVGIDAGQDCIATVLNKTATGFNVKLTPYPATATLAAGAFNVTVEA